jgi:hypothetical protein
MATYYVQPIKDKQNRLNAWEVAKNHGQGTMRISDHNRKKNAVNNASRVANKGDKVGVKGVEGSFLRWFTVTTG